MLTRLVSQEKSLAEVARTALQIMHLDVNVTTSPCPSPPSDLADRPGADCVAACYRCLMSYYNQPDHELLDRRDEDARAMLLRLACGSTVSREDQQSPVAATVGGDDSREGRWRAEASRRGHPRAGRRTSRGGRAGLSVASGASTTLRRLSRKRTSRPCSRWRTSALKSFSSRSPQAGMQPSHGSPPPWDGCHERDLATRPGAWSAPAAGNGSSSAGVLRKRFGSGQSRDRTKTRR